MPTPLKNSQNMRKHLTNSEKESRRRAEAEMKRGTRVTLRVPAWLSEDAKIVWKGIRRSLKGLELLDNVDAEMLGIYCDAVAKYRRASRALDIVAGVRGEQDLVTDEMIKQAQAWGRLISTYAEKLGLTPTARARLAKRKAEREQPDELEQLLDGVHDYMDELDGQAGNREER